MLLGVTVICELALMKGRGERLQIWGSHFLQGPDIGNRKGKGAQVGGLRKTLPLSQDVPICPESPPGRWQASWRGASLGPGLVPAHPLPSAAEGQTALAWETGAGLVYSPAVWSSASPLTSLTLKCFFWKWTQRCLPSGSMCVTCRPGWADKGDMQAGSPACV